MLRNIISGFLPVVLLLSSVVSCLASTQMMGGSPRSQPKDIVGKYVYKNYRRGKGGFENHLEITSAAGGRFHLSFELTYFYMAGRDETFHEGSGEGDGPLQGNVLTATLSDGAGGSCRVTLTLNETLIANEYTISVKSSRCAINVVPDGLYKREASKPVATVSGARQSSSSAEVCPDPKSPCNSAAKRFSPFELSFRLPSRLAKGKTYTSAPFFAVLIRTYADEACDADDHTESIEKERLQLQTYYPTRKVFAQYSCPNLDAVDYSFPGKMDSTGERVLIMTFIAVYAGKTSTEANEFLTYVKTVYPDAFLKRMTATYEILDQ